MKHQLDKTGSFRYSSGCISIRNVLKLRINKTKKSYGAIRWIIFNAMKSLRNSQKQPNEDTPVTMEKLKKRLTILLGKEKLLNKPHGGNNCYFEMQKNDNLSPQTNLITKTTYHKQEIKT